MAARLRVSFIDFLNSVPLGWGLTQQPRPDLQLLFDVPSQCARHVANGQADVGLIPVIEYQTIPGLRVLPGISISAKRESRSVLFVSRCSLERVRRVAVDTSSRTSAVLLRIVLHCFHGQRHILFQPHPADPARMLADYDAALIIGNPAMKMERSSLLVYDLAAEWYRFTGLPFVFAFWAVRPGVELRSLLDVFYQSRRFGLQQIESIARVYGARLGMEEAEVVDYLQRHLDYSLDKENLEGLRTFYRMACDLGAIPSIRPLEFYPVEQKIGA